MIVKINNRTIESIAPAARPIVVSDSDVKGFRCKITPQGKRVYLFDYWWLNRTKRITIGQHGIGFDAGQARRKAIELKGIVASRRDPKADDRRHGAITVAAFADLYLTQHAEQKKKASSVRDDRRYVNNVILPRFGKLRIADVSRAEVQSLHHKMRETPIAANRCLSLLSKMFNLAEKWGYRPDGSNPVRHIDRFKERAIERFLRPPELARLGRVLKDEDAAGANSYVTAAVRLLLFTGCRREEILRLTWDCVDLDARCLRLPDSKTGAKTVHLSQHAVDVLTGLKRRPGNPYVLPGHKRDGNLVGLPKSWHAIRAKADLAGVRLHDLRHTFASVAAQHGESLVMIGALLGHADPSTTARYAHLAGEPKRQAAERITAVIAGDLAEA